MKRLKRKLRKTGDSTAASADMEVDDDSTDENKKPNPPNPPALAVNTSSTSNPNLNLNPNSNHHPAQAPLNPPTVDYKRPPLPITQYQPQHQQIPANFNLGQGPRFHNIPPSFTPNIQLAPMNLQHSLASPQGWPGLSSVEMETR